MLIQSSSEPATKNYVDRKILNLTFLSYEGHIPPLERPISKTGFIVSTSSNYDDLLHQGWRAFSNTTKEWATQGEGVGAWIEISCPTTVTIWKLRLTDRKISDEQFATWKLSGGRVVNDGLVFDDIHAENTRLNSDIQDF